MLQQNGYLSCTRQKERRRINLKQQVNSPSFNLYYQYMQFLLLILICYTFRNKEEYYCKSYTHRKKNYCILNESCNHVHNK